MCVTLTGGEDVTLMIVINCYQFQKCKSETTIWWFTRIEQFLRGEQLEKLIKRTTIVDKDKKDWLWLWAGRILAVGWDQIERSTHHLSTTTNTTTSPVCIVVNFAQDHRNYWPP